jgi:hypothetical protein
MARVSRYGSYRPALRDFAKSVRQYYGMITVCLLFLSSFLFVIHMLNCVYLPHTVQKSVQLPVFPRIMHSDVFRPKTNRERIS